MTVYAILVTFASFWMAKQSYSWFPPEAAAEAKLQDDLFSLFTGLGTFIYLGVIGPFLYSLVFHRASKYDMSDGPPIEGNTWLEIVWTAVPLVLVLTLSFVSYRTYEKMAVRGPMELVHLHMPQMMQSAYAEPFDSTPQQDIQNAAETAPIEQIDVTLSNGHGFSIIQNRISPALSYIYLSIAGCGSRCDRRMCCMGFTFQHFASSKMSFPIAKSILN
jgi:cytochrome c oxidase subunit 2